MSIQLTDKLYAATGSKIIADSIQIAGGYMSVTSAERESLTEAQKVVGTLVFETDTGKTYRYDGTTWLEVNINETGDTVVLKGDGEKSLVGNDIDNNKALSANATALGSGTLAGSKGFRIIASSGVAGGEGTYTLENYTGEYEVDDEYSLRISNMYDKHGHITGINGNVITVDNFVADELAVLEDGETSLADKNSFRVIEKPEVGNIEIGNSAFAIGSDTKAIGFMSFAEGYNTVAYGKYSHAEGNSNEAGYAAHAEGRFNIASGHHSHAEGYTTVASGDTAHAEGANTVASGARAHAEGNNTTASGSRAHAEGEGTQAKGQHSHAEGYRSNVNDNTLGATGTISHSEGYDTTASGEASHAEGRATKATAKNSHAEGQSTTASGQGSHAQGINTAASGDYSNAEGANTIADGYGANAQGGGTKASGQYAHAEGFEGHAIGDNSHTEGYQLGTHKDGKHYGSYQTGSHAEGVMTLADGQGAHAEGYSSSATGKGAHAEGRDTIASGTYSHAEGSGSSAMGEQSHAEGLYTKSWGIGSHSEGRSTEANHHSSHAEGTSTLANGSSSHAEGLNTKALGSESHAEGNLSEAQGQDSHAEGYNTKAIGNHSHTEGANTTANNQFAHAEGKNTTASGDSSHTEGDGTKTFDKATHAEGINTIAGNEDANINAQGAHAEGYNTQAIAEVAHAEGANTVASGKRSHSEGNGTTATGNEQHVQGRYNYLDENGGAGDYAHIVGNGSSSARSNAHTLDWNGNAWFAGNVAVGKDNDKLATEKFVGDKFAEMIDSAPETLDTLNELSKALGDDPNFATTVATEIGKKVDKIEGKGLSTNDFTNEDKANLDNLNNFNIKNGNGDKSVAQCDSVTDGSYGTAFGKSTTARSDAGFTHGYKTLTAPCSKYIKNDLALTSADEHNFIIDYVGTDADITPAAISYRYWSLEQNKYLYFNEVTQSFPHNVVVTDTIEAYRDAYQSFEFTPGKSDESAYLFEDKGSVLNATTEGVWATRYADGSNYFTYKYDLSNVEWRDDTTILWTATVSNHLKLEWSTDNATWNILEDSYYSRLESKSRSYEIPVANENTLYIKISDASGNGYGGSVSKLYPVTLDVCGTAYYIDILFGGKLTTGEEMANTATAESLLAPTATGFATYAVGKGSYAGGYLTTAWKPSAFAHGYKAIALGDAATAFGGDVLVKNDRAFAAGMGLISAGHSQSVFGRYNQENSTDVMIVGWGESKSKPKNIFTLSKEGNGTFTGNINASGTLNANNANLSNDLTAKSINTTSLNATNILVDGNKIVSVNDVYLDERLRRNAFLLCSKIENDLGYVTRAVYGNNFGRWSYLGATQTERIIVKLPVENPVDITSTKKVGTWLYWGGVDGATVDVEFTSSTGSGKQGPDVEEVMFRITLKSGWNYYKLDFAYSNNSANVASGCIGYWSITTNGNNKYAPDYSKLNYIRMHTTRVDGVGSHSTDFAVGEIATILEDSASTKDEDITVTKVIGKFTIQANAWSASATLPGHSYSCTLSNIETTYVPNENSVVQFIMTHAKDELNITTLSSEAVVSATNSSNGIMTINFEAIQIPTGAVTGNIVCFNCEV